MLVPRLHSSRFPLQLPVLQTLAPILRRLHNRMPIPIRQDLSLEVGRTTPSQDRKSQRLRVGNGC